MNYLPYSCQTITDRDIKEVEKALRSSHLTQGKYVEEFEKALAKYIGVKYALTFNSATSALYAAYFAAGVKAGDEVITSPISYVATSNMILANHAKPVFVDVKDDGNIDESKIEKCISKKTKAIVPVDFAGNPVSLDVILKLCKKHKLICIEDASHAFGSLYNKKKIGTCADMTVFSFHAIKNITTAEGGALVTNSKKFFEQAKLIRSHGVEKKKLWDSDMKALGFNFRLSDIQCALGLSQLKQVDQFIKKRNNIASYYNKRFADNPYFTFLDIPEDRVCSYHLYPIFLHTKLRKWKKDIFLALQKKNLGAQVHYKPIHQNSFYKKQKIGGQYPKADAFYQSEISLPIFPNMEKKDMQYVADTVIQVCDSFSQKK